MTTKHETPKIYVIVWKTNRLETFEFSTIEYARKFTKDLLVKEFVIVIGKLATESFKSM
jgi:hypothetical protein